MSSSNRSAMAAWLIAASLAGSVSAPAEAADFYAGKTVTILVGTDESGGFSLYSRLVAPYLSRTLPGAPAVIVRNLPGAGGSTAATYMTQQAPRDGTILATVPPNAMMDRLFGRKTQVDATQFGFVGGAERGTRLCVVSARSGLTTLADAIKSKAIIGATQQGSPTSDYANFLKRSTDATFSIVNGYSGTGALYLALERGEIDGICGVDWTALKAQMPGALRDKSMHVLVQFNEQPDPELTEMGVAQPWSHIHRDIDHKAVKLMVNFQQAFGKAYFVPPQTPTEQLGLLQKAFTEILNNQRLLKDAKKQRLDVHSVGADEVAHTVHELYRAPKDVIERLEQLTSDTGR